MSSFDWVITVLTVMSVLVIPLLVIAFRGAMKWTRVEASLENLVSDVSKLVADKDKVHVELLEQMRLDRDANDRRLRFVEEWFMMAGQKQMKP